MKKTILIVIALNVFLLSKSQTYQHYIQSYSRSSVEVRDADYYKRLDEIQRQKFELNLSYLSKAYDYAKKEDYESAYFWARKMSTSFQDIVDDKYFLLSISSIKLKDKSTYKMYLYRAKDYCEPSMVKIIYEELKKSGLKIPWSYKKMGYNTHP